MYVDVADYTIILLLVSGVSLRQFHRALKANFMMTAAL